ncbi:MAG TPA: glycosyltransferase family 39 protein [Thermoguttaceae bacterium]|nr:glycosyltransferase family 39 protein [Thermoguttaceae bacterium]
MIPVAFGTIILVLVLLVAAWPLVDGRRRWALVALGLIVILGLAHQCLFQTISGDAFITFRYARNLASGHGPVFNPGDHVEGYTNFLLMVSLAALHALAGLDIPATARVLGIVCNLLAIVLTYGLSCKLTGGHRPTALIAALIVAASGCFAAYGPSGMETPLFTVLILAVIWSTINESWFFVGLLIALTTMTRPEGILLVLPALGWCVYCSPTKRQSLRPGLAVLGAVSLLLVPWTLWRLSYYGYLLPNQIEAKRGMELGHQIMAGGRYLWGFVVYSLPLVLPLFALAGLAFAGGFPRGLRRSAAVDRLLFFTTALFVLFAVGVGGDWMPGCRFLVPVVPLLSILLLKLWKENVCFPQLCTSNRRVAAVFVLLAAFLFVHNTLSSDLLPRVRSWAAQVEGLAQIGRWLHDSLPADTVVATHANGALSYYSDLPTIDMLGLTDEHIARSGERKPRGAPGHIAHDYPYVAGRKPAVVAYLFAVGRGFAPEPYFGVDRPFQTEYVPVSFKHNRCTNPYGQYVNLLLLRSERKELVRHLCDPSQDVEVFFPEPDIQRVGTQVTPVESGK